MTFIRRAVSGIALLAMLVIAGLYLPAPVSTAAWIILGLLALALLLPLALALVNIFSDDDDGWFGNVLETWFLWSALEWPWRLVGGLFRAGDSIDGRNRSGHTTAGDATSHAPATPESASDPALAPGTDVDDVAATVNDVAVSGERRGGRRRQRRGGRRAPR